MHFSRTFLISFLILTLLIGCSTEKDFIMTPLLPKINNQFTPSIIWHHSIGNGSGKYYSQLSPIYNDSIVYAADRKGIVKSMDATSGKILWSINLSEQIGFLKVNLSTVLSSGLTISGDKLYIGTEIGKVIALSKINGKIIWEKDVAGEVLSQPVVSDGILLVHTSNGVLQALDSQTGQNKWNINLDISTLSIRGKSTPAIAYGIVIIGSDTGRITAIMLDQGQIIWQQYISKIYGITEIDRLHDIDITPVIDINSGTIFVIAYNGDLVAIDIHSSKIIWKCSIGSVNNIIISNNIIYLVDQNNYMLAIYKNNGVILWTQNALSDRNLTAPIIYDGYLVVGDQNGYLYWLNIHNGRFVAYNKLDNSGLHSRPVIAGDKLLIQSKNGTIYLIKR
ncbi:MAG: outer membrane protein assembly factor BamB [Arsenophonus sp. ET-KM2-MAG3]